MQVAGAVRWRLQGQLARGFCTAAWKALSYHGPLQNSMWISPLFDSMKFAIVFRCYTVLLSAF